jgi:hypothetical protein
VHMSSLLRVARAGSGERQARMWHSLRRRSESEGGRLRRGNAAHGRGDRRRTGARVGYALEQIAGLFTGIVQKPDAETSAMRAQGGAPRRGQSQWQATALLELNTYSRQGHASVVNDTVERITGVAARRPEQWLPEQDVATDAIE